MPFVENKAAVAAVIVLGALLLAAAVVTYACMLASFCRTRRLCRTRDSVRALAATRLSGKGGALTSGWTTSGTDVLGAMAAYATQQMKNGGWKAICDGVSISVGGKTTRLTNMDLTGIAMGGSSDPKVKGTSTFDLPPCSADPGVPCGACTCDSPTLWPFSGCDATQGCGAKCGSTCCNTSAAGSVQYAVQLGTVQGIDGLFASATSTSFRVSQDREDSLRSSLVLTVVLTNGTVSIKSIDAKWRVCNALKNLTGIMAIDATATLTGPLTLTVPFQSSSCATTLSFLPSTLDCSSVAVTNLAVSVNGDSLSNYLEKTLVPLCSALSVAGAAICAASIPLLLQGFNGTILKAVQQIATENIPRDALSSLSAVTLPMPCVFCAPAPQALAPHALAPLSGGRDHALAPLSGRYRALAPLSGRYHALAPHALSPSAFPRLASMPHVSESNAPRGASGISLPSALTSLVGTLLVGALNAAFVALWKNKWNNYARFPSLYFSDTMFARVPNPPQLSHLQMQDCVLDLAACTMTLTASAVTVDATSVSLTAASADSVDSASITFGCTIQAGASVNYDPATGGTLNLSIADIRVTNAAGAAQSSPPNPLTDLLNTLLQAQNFVTCLASFATGVLPLPLALSAIPLGKGLPIPKTVCSGAVKFACDESVGCAVAEDGTFPSRSACLQGCKQAFYACTPDATGVAACTEADPSVPGAQNFGACSALCTAAGLAYGDRVALYVANSNVFLGTKAVSGGLTIASFVGPTAAAEVQLRSSYAATGAGPIRDGDPVYLSLVGTASSPLTMATVAFGRVYFATSGSGKGWTSPAFTVTTGNAGAPIATNTPVRFSVANANANPPQTIFLGNQATYSNPDKQIEMNPDPATSQGASWVLLKRA